MVHLRNQNSGHLLVDDISLEFYGAAAVSSRRANGIR